MSTATQPQTQTQEPSRTRALIARANGIEKIIYASIGRAISRRPWKAQDAQGFYYHSQTLTVLFTFVVLSAAEIVLERPTTVTLPGLPR